QLDAAQSTLGQAFDKVRPERLGFGWTNAEADDLAPALGRDCHGDYRGYRDDAAAVAHFEVGGIEPEIRPFAVERPVEEGVDPLVDILAQLGDLAFRDAGQAHCLHELVDATGRHAADPGLLDHHDQRFLGGLARLQERREVRALPQLGNAQAQRPEPRIGAAIAVAVAVIEAFAGAFVPGCHGP